MIIKYKKKSFFESPLILSSNPIDFKTDPFCSGFLQKINAKLSLYFTIFSVIWEQ
ncbi:hypothetical protein L697_03465 [Streptococcus oralis subsp. tigurinus 2425]|nr:hypothetical protein L697_03465 [Streptococcus oralis subsp. tigurinus 2425]